MSNYINNQATLFGCTSDLSACLFVLSGRRFAEDKEEGSADRHL